MIETEVPDCEYWNFVLHNWWMESLDHDRMKTYINNHTAKLNTDGTLTIVVAAETPATATGSPPASTTKAPPSSGGSRPRTTRSPRAASSSSERCQVLGSARTVGEPAESPEHHCCPISEETEDDAICE